MKLLLLLVIFRAGLEFIFILTRHICPWRTRGICRCYAIAEVDVVRRVHTPHARCPRWDVFQSSTDLLPTIPFQDVDIIMLVNSPYWAKRTNVELFKIARYRLPVLSCYWKGNTSKAWLFKTKINLIVIEQFLSATLVKSKIRSSFLFWTKVTTIRLNRVYKLNGIDFNIIRI